MNKNKTLLIIWLVLLFGQIIIFSDYISPIHWGELKVSGQSCTCPDEKIVNGSIYLRTITPDSLKKFDIDYSEIYVAEKPSTDTDPMGVDLYILEGEVIGKDRVSKNDPWKLKFKINKWRGVNIIIDWIVKTIFAAQVFFIIKIIFRGKK